MDEGEKRDKQVHIRVTADEKMLIGVEAWSVGCTVTELILRRCIDGDEATGRKDTLKETLDALERMGELLGKIEGVVDMSGVSEELVGGVRERYGKIKHNLRESDGLGKW